MIYVQQTIEEFTYSNIPALTAIYNKTTEYGVGDEVRVGIYIYNSVATINTNHYPPDNQGAYWYKWGPSNAYSMLDLLEETKTEWVADGIVEFDRGIKEVLGIGNFKATLIKVEYLDALNVVLDTEEYTFANTGDVVDVWTYGYAGFTDSTSQTVYTYMKRLGTKIRVTFSSDGLNTNCGYFVAGAAVSMGKTLNNVSFPDKRIGSRTVNTATFKTIVRKNELMRKATQAKLLVDEVMMFVIDEGENSLHNNMIILGKMTSVSSVGSNSGINDISWTIEQTILE